MLERRIAPVAACVAGCVGIGIRIGIGIGIGRWRRGREDGRGWMGYWPPAVSGASGASGAGARWKLRVELELEGGEGEEMAVGACKMGGRDEPESTDATLDRQGAPLGDALGTQVATAPHLALALALPIWPAAGAGAGAGVGVGAAARFGPQLELHLVESGRVRSELWRAAPGRNGFHSATQRAALPARSIRQRRLVRARSPLPARSSVSGQ